MIYNEFDRNSNAPVSGLTQCQRVTDRQTDRRTDNSTVANAGCA